MCAELKMETVQLRNRNSDTEVIGSAAEKKKGKENPFESLVSLRKVAPPDVKVSSPDRPSRSAGNYAARGLVEL